MRFFSHAPVCESSLRAFYIFHHIGATIAQARDSFLWCLLTSQPTRIRNVSNVETRFCSDTKWRVNTSSHPVEGTEDLGIGQTKQE